MNPMLWNRIRSIQDPTFLTNQCSFDDYIFKGGRIRLL
jgi:hypothetical protein